MNAALDIRLESEPESFRKSVAELRASLTGMSLKLYEDSLLDALLSRDEKLCRSIVGQPAPDDSPARKRVERMQTR